MVCRACRVLLHEECLQVHRHSYTWCDCRHRPSSTAAPWPGALAQLQPWPPPWDHEGEDG